MDSSLKKSLLHKWNVWAGIEKTSHLSNRNETKWFKTNLFAYLCSYKSPIGITLAGNNNVYEKVWKKDIKNIIKNIYDVFLQYEILKAQNV